MSVTNTGHVLPKTRQGTAGLEADEDIKAGETVFLFVPERISSVTVGVNIPKGQTAAFKIEYSLNAQWRIGEDGKGGFWHNHIKDDTVYTESTDITFVNNVSAVRVQCIAASGTINVCIRG